jgi:hypothetical protein
LQFFAHYGIVNFVNNKLKGIALWMFKEDYIMKRFPKLIVTLLVLAMAIGIFAAIPVSAANDYEALRLKSAHITVGHYTTLDMNGEIVKHSANKDYNHEIGCLVDNDNNGGYWSKPYKFSDLRESDGKTNANGKITPVILIDVEAYNSGSPRAVAAFDLRLRSSMDCRPLHVVLQATTAANSNSWTTVADKKFTYADWDASPKQRIEFSEVTVYKFRMLVYEIGEADIAADEYKDYDRLKGDETRFTLSEIDLLAIKEGGSGSTGGTTNPTTGGNTQTPTRPNISVPTRPGTTTAPTQPATQAPTQPATKAPTQPATKAPTQPATQAATKAPTQPATQAPTQAATQAATKAPNQPATQAPTQAATQAPTTTTEPTGTVAPTEPTATVDPSATTEPTGTVDPSAPTEEPTVAPTEAPTVAPTEEPTVAPTVEATEPEATTPNTDTTGNEEKPNNSWIIIVAIVAVAAIGGGAVFFIIKKKKNG